MIRFALILVGFFLFSNVNALELSPRAFLGIASYSLEDDVDSSIKTESSHPIAGFGFTLFNPNWHVDLFHQRSLSATFKTKDDYEDDFSQSNTALTIGKRIKQAILYAGLKMGNSVFSADLLRSIDNKRLKERSYNHTLLFVGGGYSFIIGRKSSFNISFSIGVGSGTLEEKYKNLGPGTSDASADGSATGGNLNLGFSSFINQRSGFTLQLSSQALKYSKLKEEGKTLDFKPSESTVTLTAQAFLYF